MSDDVWVIVGDGIYGVHARVLGIVHIRLVFVTREETPPAVFRAVWRFSIHIPNRHAVHRDSIRRQGATHWADQILYLIGAKLELFLSWVGHEGLLGASECCHCGQDERAQDVAPAHRMPSNG